ncbi:MAG: Fe-S cluster assembly protein SufD [Actinomycetales bacterium]
MTTPTLVPVDHAPKLASLDPESFAVPTGREEEWRFAPLANFNVLLHANAAAGDVRAIDPQVFDSGSRVANLPIAEVNSTWVPTDRASVIARAGVKHAILIDIPADVTEPEPIHVRLRAPEAVNYLHGEIRIGTGSSATVIVEHDLQATTGGAVIINVGSGAHLKVLNLVDGPDSDVLHLHVHVNLDRDAHAQVSSITLGGGQSRQVTSVDFAGPGAAVELLGAFLASGQQYQEHRMFVEHRPPHCSSTVTYKGALTDSAHSVWVGDVLVRNTATGTNTYELNRNLILQDGPRADSVPNLELETGDVQGAGHASATGRFDDDQLFYLQARGIDEITARKLIVHGFFADIINRLAVPAWQGPLLGRIAQRLGGSTEADS